MDRLTPRERDVFRCRCRDGLSVKETAAALGLSRGGAANAGTRLLRKLGARTTVEACRSFWRSVVAGYAIEIPTASGKGRVWVIRRTGEG